MSLNCNSHLFCRRNCCDKRKHCFIHAAVLKWQHIPEWMIIKMFSI